MTIQQQHTGQQQQIQYKQLRTKSSSVEEKSGSVRDKLQAHIRGDKKREKYEGDGEERKSVERT